MPTRRTVRIALIQSMLGDLRYQLAEEIADGLLTTDKIVAGVMQWDDLYFPSKEELIEMSGQKIGELESMLGKDPWWGY